MKIIRQGTSDEKAYREVVLKKGYERKGFRPMPGEAWLDIGAHIGSFAWMYRAQGVRVKAFEPTRETFEVLQMNSPSAENYNCGLGKETKTSALSRNTRNKNEWRNSLYKKWAGGIVEEVEVRDILEFIIPGINLKIDCEGAELDILNRLIFTGKIKEVNKIVLEYSFDILPKMADYVNLMLELRKTHDLLNVSDKHLARYGSHETYPPSWFPACYKIFAVKKQT